VLRAARVAPATVVAHLERWAKNMSTSRKDHLRSKMPTYYLLIGLIFLLVNFGYAFGRLGRGEKEVVSPTLLVASGLAAFFLLRWIRKRLIEMDRRDSQLS
jgi:hypothetical protein